MLNLTYLATGSFQHVFTETGMVDGAWVYKVPAAFGYILPYPTSRSILTPHNFYERALKLTLIRVPDALLNRVSRRRALYREARQWRQLSIPLAFLERSCERGQAAGRRLIAAYCKPRRRRKFHAMLDLLEYIAAQGLADTVLPFAIIPTAAATLRVNGRAFSYEGPILMQRKASCVFENGESFRSFDWSDVVESVHRLWRHGVGLSESLRPWAVLEGRARLFDTSGLTRDADKLWRSTSEETMDGREGMALREWERLSSDCCATEYFRFVRREVNQERLRQLWQADLKGGARRRL